MISAAVKNQAGGRMGEIATFPIPVANHDNIPVMLSIRETAEIFRLPVHFVRELVRAGKVYAVQAGSKKFYVNQGSMINYLTGGETR